MKIKTLKIFILCLISLNCIAQKKDKSQTEKCIRTEVINFFINIERLETDHKNELNSILILEVLEKRVLEHDAIGIYFCTDLSSHRKKYLLLKNNQEIKILNSSNILTTVEDILSFLKKNNVSNLKATAYLTECINILDNNTEKIVDKIIQEQQWVKCN